MLPNSNLKFVIIIPARYQSSRLPGKPLLNICGQSMISRTYKRCVCALNEEDVYVATDDDRIKDHCSENGINVIMTSQNCLTGTDRVYEASKQVDADIYVNVQGDEPIINPKDIQKVIEESLKNPGHIINGMSEIGEESEWRSENIPKVVTRPDGRLLYMSRAAIPTNKSLGFIHAQKQVCVYAFPKKALADFASLKEKTPLEAVEDIEILRFLELDHEVFMLKLSPSLSVDVLEDINKVERIINEQNV